MTCCVLESRLQIHTAAVAPMSQVGEQIRDDKKGIVVVTDNFVDGSSTPSIGAQSDFCPRCALRVGRTFIGGCVGWE